MLSTTLKERFNHSEDYIEDEKESDKEEANDDYLHRTESINCSYLTETKKSTFKK